MHVLVIRFSSFGDILQSLPAVSALSAHNTSSRISYLTKKQFVPLVKNHPAITQTEELLGKGSFLDLWQMARRLSENKYTHVYDAHNNLRSHLFCIFLRFFGLLRGTHFSLCRRSKNRWKRFLFFKLHRPVFKMPFRGAESFIEPLKQWGVLENAKHQKNLFLDHSQSIQGLNLPSTFVALAPSAAWPNKRWPVDHWKRLIESLPQIHFVLLGGPEDLFCEDIARASSNTTNLAGKLNLMESCEVVEKAAAVISGDTGLLHAADQMEKKVLALIGPTAFGYPWNASTSQVLEVELPCKPCSKDGRTPCVNPIYQKCMVDINPNRVKLALLDLLNEKLR
jgi:ADP-heptose:LPS heptosyltransferase